MKYTINVTKDDIANGIKWSIYRCPVATAATRAIGKVCWTGIYTIGFGKGEQMNYITLPDTARKAIRSFDANKGMQPFSFEIELQDE